MTNRRPSTATVQAVMEKALEGAAESVAAFQELKERVLAAYRAAGWEGAWAAGIARAVEQDQADADSTVRAVAEKELDLTPVMLRTKARRRYRPSKHDARGRPAGSGSFAESDAVLVEEFRRRRAAGESPQAIKRDLAPKIEGPGTEASRMKRLERRAGEKNPGPISSPKTARKP